MSYLKTKEIASILRISMPTVRRLIAKGELTAIHIGSQLRIDASELARYLRANAKQNGHEANA